MKKVLIYLLALTILGCSDGPENKSERQTITVNTILNENSSPHTGTTNQVIYQTASTVELPQTTGIEKITIHSITVKARSYSCSPSEIHGTLFTEYTIPSGISIDAFPFIVKENYTGTIPYKEFLKGMAKQLQAHGVTDIDFQTSLPQAITAFEIELAIDIDMTIVYAE